MTDQAGRLIFADRIAYRERVTSPAQAYLLVPPRGELVLQVGVVSWVSRAGLSEGVAGSVDLELLDDPDTDPGEPPPPPSVLGSWSGALILPPGQARASTSLTALLPLPAGGRVRLAARLIFGGTGDAVVFHDLWALGFAPPAPQTRP